MSKPKKKLVARSIRYGLVVDEGLKILADRDNRSVNQYVVQLLKKDVAANRKYIDQVKGE